MSAKVVIKPRRAKPFWLGEPWVYDGSVERVKGTRDLADGDDVEVLDSEGRTIGFGFFNGRSRIRVRLVSGPDRPIDEALIIERLDRAVQLRVDRLRFDGETDAYRLVHAEGDGLPGLVIDRLGDYLVMQIDSLGMRRYRDPIVHRLARRLSPIGIFERVSHTAREQEGIEALDGVAFGDAPHGPVAVVESDVRYLVDVRLGQKTGFYTDQRENRLALARWSHGADFLDAFSYTGAFGLTAMVRGQAARVTAIDSSKPALEAAAANAVLNGISVFEPVQANVLRQLDHWRKEGRAFDVVSLDPPKLVPKAGDLMRGLKLYHEINVKGISTTKDGGILATSSCSQHVGEADFMRMIAAAAFEARARLQLLHVGGQGADHPVLLPHEDSRYLKFLIFRVERDAVAEPAEPIWRREAKLEERPEPTEPKSEDDDPSR